MFLLKKCFITVLLCVLLALPTPTFASRAATFSDVPVQNSHHINILMLADQKIINGYTEQAMFSSGYVHTLNRFRPNSKVTNRQAALMLARALKLEDSTIQAPKFKDVSKTDSAYKAIALTTAKGIFPDGEKFNPNAFISRASMARALQRAFNIQRGSQQYAIKDVPSSHWAYQYIMPLVTTGISTGYADKTFKPSDGVTRAQFASFLNRALKYHSSEKNIVKNLTAYQRHQIEDRIGEFFTVFVPDYNAVTDGGLSFALEQLSATEALPYGQHLSLEYIDYNGYFEFSSATVKKNVQQFLGVDVTKYDLNYSNPDNTRTFTDSGEEISYTPAYLKGNRYVITASPSYMGFGTIFKYDAEYPRMLELYEIEDGVYYAIIAPYLLFTYEFPFEEIPHRDADFNSFPKYMFNALELQSLRYLVVDTSQGFAFDKLRIPYMSKEPLPTVADRQAFMKQYRAKQ